MPSFHSERAIGIIGIAIDLDARIHIFPLLSCWLFYLWVLKQFLFFSFEYTIDTVSGCCCYLNCIVKVFVFMQFV